MSRITRIRDVAASSKGNLSDALLQCLVLADELNYDPLSDWANLELSGYRSKESLPDYRKAHSSLRGNLIEGARYTSNYTIPDLWIDATYRDDALSVPILDGIPKLLTLPDDGSMGISSAFHNWVEGRINNKLQSEHGPLVGVRSVVLLVPPGTYARVIGAVQQRIVQFMIQLNRMFPSDDNLENSSSKQFHQVDDAFRSIINISNAGNVVFSNGIGMLDQSTNVSVSVSIGDFGSLSKYLRSLSIPENAIAELEPLVKKIADGNRTEESKRSLKEWVGKQVSEIPETAGEVVTDGAKRALTESIVNGIKEFAPKAAEWISGIDFPFDSMPM